jgi:hypothetical protein
MTEKLQEIVVKVDRTAVEQAKGSAGAGSPANPQAVKSQVELREWPNI